MEILKKLIKKRYLLDSLKFKYLMNLIEKYDNYRFFKISIKIMQKRLKNTCKLIHFLI